MLFSSKLFASLSIIALAISPVFSIPQAAVNGAGASETCPVPKTVTVTASAGAGAGASSSAATAIATDAGATTSAAPAATTTAVPNTGGGSKGTGNTSGGRGGGRGGRGGGRGRPGRGGNRPTSTAAATTPTTTTTPGTGTGGGAGNGGANNGNGGGAGTGTGGGAGAGAGAGNGGVGNGNGNGAVDQGGDPQTSLTLSPAVIAPGFANDGQDVPNAGQVASLTSNNNFINFCLTVNKPITNGQQIKEGSCNPAPIGVIASTSNMPSSKFTSPKNGDTIPANQPFTVSMAINNLQTGNFVNAASNYYAAPQQVDGQGNIIGHTHFYIQKLESLGQTTPVDPADFDFFKGVNGAAVNGIVTADVTTGLDAGVYRMGSINSAANHQPVLVAVAQHGALDDMVYFTVA